MQKETADTKALLNVKEMCGYLGTGQTKARELLSDPYNGFAVRIGNGLYALRQNLIDGYQTKSCNTTQEAVMVRIQCVRSRLAKFIECFKDLW